MRINRGASAEPSSSANGHDPVTVTHDTLIPPLERWATRADAALDRGSLAYERQRAQLLDRTAQAAGRLRAQPFTSVLMAAAAGAVVMAVLDRVTRRGAA